MVRLLNRPDRMAALVLIAAGFVAGAPALAADPAHGKSVFASQCSMCHSAARNGPTLLGPALFGVAGRPSASVAGFAYSPALKAAGFTWTDAKLGAFLPGPAKMVPGTKMTFPGLKSPDQVDDVIAYLHSLK